MKQKEKLIKSKKRVQEFAEVYTPSFIVNDMCDLIPSETWENIDSTFLEPACGNGNFLIEILRRKLKYCNNDSEVIRAYKSIYGIDIQPDNVTESRMRMLSECPRLQDINTLLIISEVLSHNIICADSLKKCEEWIDVNKK